MNARLALLALCTLLHAVARAGEPDAYLCVSDLVTGFVFEKEMIGGQWRANEYAAGERYLITRPPGHYRNEGAWVVMELGGLPHGFLLATCKKDFDVFGRLYCQGNLRHNYQFLMNKETLRFVQALVDGYVGMGPEPDRNEGQIEQPWIMIGRCNPAPRLTGDE